MTVKIIVFDLDRTLLHTDETISAYSLRVLNRCREAGLKVIYATGRGDRSAKSVAPCEYFDGRITQGGAVAVIGEDVISKCIIPCEKVRQLLIAFEKFGLRTMAEDNRLYYGSAETHDFVVTTGWSKSANFKIVDINSHNMDAEKINVFLSAPSEIELVKKNLPDDLCLTMAHGGHGMIIRKETTKTIGIMKLAEPWGINLAEIAAFGDDFIDIDMLKYCGTGVAVANAIDEVKAVADFICGTNDEDGPARWIEENILLLP